MTFGVSDSATTGGLNGHPILSFPVPPIIDRLANFEILVFLARIEMHNKGFPRPFVIGKTCFSKSNIPEAARQERSPEMKTGQIH